MKLQDQVCTKQHAIQLKILGVKQRSVFYHHPNFDAPVFGNKWTTKVGKKYEKTMVQSDKESASAFTVAELCSMLGDYDDLSFTWIDIGNKRRCYVSLAYKEGMYIDKFGDTQAEALGLLLINLLKTKLITIDKINARLCS